MSTTKVERLTRRFGNIRRKFDSLLHDVQEVGNAIEYSGFPDGKRPKPGINGDGIVNLEYESTCLEEEEILDAIADHGCIKPEDFGINEPFIERVFKAYMGH